MCRRSNKNERALHALLMGCIALVLVSCTARNTTDDTYETVMAMYNSCSQEESFPEDQEISVEEVLERSIKWNLAPAGFEAIW